MMLSAPVSDNKAKEQQGKTESEPEMDGFSRSGGWAGYGSLSPGNGRLAAASQPLGKRAHQARMQKAYGNQAMLRMMNKSPAPAPVTASPLNRGGILQRKCACGNTAGASGSCAECEKKGGMGLPGNLQTKLTVNQPGDRYEQEADRVAEQVMIMPDPAALSVQRMAGDDKQEGIQTQSLTTSITPLLQREAMPEEEKKKKEEEESIQTKPALQGAKNNNSLETGHNLESRLNNIGSGSPLPNDVRAFMEPRFRADFSGVRVHTGSDAAQMNRDLSAQAFTYDNDIYPCFVTLGETNRPNGYGALISTFCL